MTLERTTVHISDDTGRIAMLEARTQGSDDSPEQLHRYSYSNHLGSSALELDQDTNIISYEEYHPYGTTAYQALNSDIKAVAKRYRYTGKERDEESGFYYHGARYYAPWLCRWTAVDPLEGKYTGWSPYHYVLCNPIGNIDPNGKQHHEKNGSSNKQSGQQNSSTAGPGDLGPRVSWGMDNNKPIGYSPSSQPIMLIPSEETAKKMQDAVESFEYFVLGIANALVTDNTFGVGRTNPDTIKEHGEAFALGQIVGDFIAMAQGEAEEIGGTFFAVFTAETGVGAVGGVAVAVHGAGVTITAQIGLLSDAVYLMSHSPDDTPNEQPTQPSKEINSDNTGDEDASKKDEATTETQDKIEDKVKTTDEGVKLTNGGKSKIGNLASSKDKKARDVLKERGGHASATKQGDVGDWWDKSLGEVANAAASGDEGAETVIKQVKQAKKKAGKYGGN
ncbi:RHS repeat-associated core domain-containing protein [Chitinophagaceae bacterium MMS25-I14]